MDYARARERMVEAQLEARGIRNREVLRALREVPRHLFVDEALAPSAYGDHALPIGFGQTISQPYMVALMTELLSPGPDDRVLEIGAGSGYQTAVLARLARTVFAIERIPELLMRGQRTLDALGVRNVVLRGGDGTLGWRRFAPFDAILVAAGSPEIPPTLLEQLRGGGRMVIPTGDKGRQVLQLVEKGVEGAFISRAQIPCSFVPLLGREGWQESPGEP